MQNTVDGPYTVTLDDDESVPKIIEKALGLPTRHFAAPEEFLRALPKLSPQGIFVDVHLGIGVSGLDLLPAIREHAPYLPIIVVTGDQSDKAIGQALAAGANDFTKKPINPQELKARFQARCIEMLEKAGRDVVTIGDIRLDIRLRRLEGADGVRHLSQADTDLMAYLIQAQGTVVSKADLKRKLWGNLKISDNALDKKIYELRQALRDLSRRVSIRSSYGRGITLLQSEAAGQDVA